MFVNAALLHVHRRMLFMTGVALKDVSRRRLENARREEW